MPSLLCLLLLFPNDSDHVLEEGEDEKINGARPGFLELQLFNKTELGKEHMYFCTCQRIPYKIATFNLAFYIASKMQVLDRTIVCLILPSSYDPK